MKNRHDLLNRTSWHVLDESATGLTKNPMHSFAMDDTLCKRVSGENNRGIARTWVHDRTIVLGIQDSRLPYIDEGIHFLRENGYDVIVRNSGGLAVVLDEGIFNLSLIFKEEKRLSIDSGYEAMTSFVRHWLEDLGLDIVDGEIAESYCPGRYDLSVGGQKFAGISQRRLRGGVAVQIYLAVNGSGSKRAALIRRFYDKAVNGATTKFSYPEIIPEKMASLEEISGKPLAMTDLLHSLLLTLRPYSEQLGNLTLTEEDWHLYEKNLERIIKRNEKL
ncbi:lipoate--protein ligase family protein [Alteribacter populi]|uniref:lipoate--protein ligase family protein n=1 Tax=Alteribacter populi TaxID=2011011 RepID=UPI000BBACFAD|nr:lipoate--protein ligase family protein [Alteribacter populi]